MDQIWIIISLLVGVGVGVWGDPTLLSIAGSLAEVFMNLLKLVSLPLLFLAVLSTLTGMEGFGELRRLARRVLGYTVLTTVAAATVALCLFLVVRPTGSAEGGELVEMSGSLVDHLVHMIPTSVIQPFLEHNVVGVMLLAVGLSGAVLTLPNEQRSLLHGIFAALFGAVMKVTSTLVRFLPFVVWSFVAVCFGCTERNGSLFWYLACVVGANVIQATVILPLLLLSKGISPIRTFRAMVPALTVAFFSKSSAAAMPTAMECAEKRLGLDPKVVRFTFPFCITINMNACAGFILTTVLFVAGSHGVVFSPIELVGWVLIASIAALGNAGVPMGCYFLSHALLSTMGVPLYLMGAILPFYTLLDMLETAINVWSDACVATLTVRRATVEVEPANAELAAAS